MKPLPAQAQSQRPRHLDAAGRERGTDPLRLPTGPNDLGRQLERGDRDWPQELDGDARQPEFARIGTCALDGTGEESRGRSAMLVLVAPGTARQLGRDEARIIPHEEGVHGRTLALSRTLLRGGVPRIADGLLQPLP